MKHLNILILTLFFSCNSKEKLKDVKKTHTTQEIEVSNQKEILTKEKNSNFIDPTGTYVCNEKINRMDENMLGHFGDIQVLTLSKTKLVMTFYYCNGAPSYNSGSFIDTLEYQNNTCLYTTNEDASCKISFEFTKNGIKVDEKTDDYNFGCGFGHGVVAISDFIKKSAKKPILMNASTGDKY